MKIVIKKESLMLALSIPYSVSGKTDKVTSEMLKFDMNGTTIKVTAVCNGLEANLYCVAESIEEPIPFLLNAKRVYDLVRSYAPEKDIIIESIKGTPQLVFKQGRSKHKVDAMSTEAFPEDTQPFNVHSEVNIEFNALNEALHLAGWAVAHANKMTASNQFLASVKFALDDGYAKIVSADGFKLVSGTVQCNVIKSEAPEVLIPKRLMEILRQFHAYKPETITLTFNNDKVQVFVPTIGKVTSTVCSLKYPDLTDKSDAALHIETKVNNQEFVNAIKRFSAGVDNKTAGKHGINIDFKENEINITDRCSGSSETLEAQVLTETKEGSYCFSLKMLGDVIGHLNGEETVIGVNVMKWAHFRQVGDEYNTKTSLLEYKA